MAGSSSASPSHHCSPFVVLASLPSTPDVVVAPTTTVTRCLVIFLKEASRQGAVHSLILLCASALSMSHLLSRPTFPVPITTLVTRYCEGGTSWHFVIIMVSFALVRGNTSRQCSLLPAWITSWRDLASLSSLLVPPSFFAFLKSLLPRKIVWPSTTISSRVRVLQKGESYIPSCIVLLPVQTS